jgi:Ni,Fe-hydrogenase maturation factor
MLPESLDIVTTCVHISHADSDEPAEDAMLMSSKSNRNAHSVAVVALGNPLVDYDGLAIEALRNLVNNCRPDLNFCAFALDTGIFWLQKIISVHDEIILVDTMQGLAENFVIVPLTNEIVARSGFQIRATHGLSWMDELKLSALNRGETSLTFFGINRDLQNSATREAVQALDSTVNELSSRIARQETGGSTCA